MDKIKDIYFNHTTEQLLKHILTPLKNFKNRRQVAKKFIRSDVFPTDHFKNPDEKITVLCEHYLNALKIYKLLETTTKNNIKFSHYSDYNILEITDLKNKKNIISFYRIYDYLISDTRRIGFLKFSNTRKFYYSLMSEIFIEVDKWFTEFFNKEKWTLSNNNLKTCCVSGFIFRKNDVVQLNDDRKYNLNNFKGLFHFRNYKLTDQDYINHRFIDYGNQYWNISWNANCDNDYNFFYDSDKNFALFSYDKKDENKVNLKSAKNKLRLYSFPVHENLPFAMLENEEKTKKNNLYFGLELEVGYQSSCPRNKIHQLIEESYLKGLAICKTDGSVSNGFEINLVPMTFDYIKTSNVFFNFFDKTQNYLRSYNMSNTGIHIHVSRKQLSDLQVGKILEFTNSKINKNYIIDVSGRDPQRTGFSEINETLKTKDIQLMNTDSHKRKNKLSDRDYRVLNKLRDKYQAINLQHDDTIEFRIFKGNTKPQTISRYIEFTHALVMFTKQVNSKNLDHKDFIKYVTNEKNIYPFLNEFNQKFLGNHNITLKEEFTYQPRILKQLRIEEIKLKEIKVFTEDFKKKNNRKIIKR